MRWKSWKLMGQRVAATVLATAMCVTSPQISVLAGENEPVALSDELTAEEAFVLKDENFQLGDTYWNEFAMVYDWYGTDVDAGKTAVPKVSLDSREISSDLFSIDGNKLTIKADGNIIENGDFSDGFSNWTPYFNERYSGSASITSDFLVQFTINFFLNWYDEAGNDNGPVTWSTMLTHNSNIQVEKGKTYVFRFVGKSTVERPILVELDGRSYYFVLTPELQTFSAEYVCNTTKNTEVKFHMGPIPKGGANDTGKEILTTDGHTISLGDISLVDKEIAEVGTSSGPSVIGVENGGQYTVPVSAKVNYRNAYSLSLTKDGQPIEYTEGDMILADGNYVLTVTDEQDATIKTVKTFTIQKDIDYTKTYYAIASKATELVMEAVGNKDGGSVVQSSFKGRPGQLFTIETVRGDYFIIRALSTGMVVAVENDSKDSTAKLIQTEYTGENSQLWKYVTVPQGYVKIENKNSGLVIDISGANKTENLQLQQYANSGSTDEGQSSADGQRFDIIEISNVEQYLEVATSKVSTEDEWKENAFITPIANKLNPAGPIAVEWYRAPGTVESYDIYFDGKKCKTIEATEDETLKTEDQDIYSVEVNSHTMKIVANYAGGKTVESKEISFYITKKGVGWGTLHRTEDMNLSWYYHWATDPSLGTDENLAFVPMIWGNYGDEWLADPQNQKYGTVLSFNEPDWSDQSNVPVTKESAAAWAARYEKIKNEKMDPPKSLEEAWQAFMDSGLRIGSPATALAPPYCLGQITMNEIDGPDDWWQQFQDLMDATEGWDYDFVAIHSYNDGCDAKSFLNMVDETYAMTGKPIWITEFGVAKWDGSSGTWNGSGTQREQVRQFMIDVITGLEERDYVERYAWFPFDPDDSYGGASGVFNYATGELTELGKTYAMLGLPDGYEGTKYEIGPIEPSPENPGDEEDEKKPATSISINKNITTMTVGDTATITYEVVPADTTDEITFTSSAPDVASVNANGVITALSEGTANITVKTDSNQSDMITVTVKPEQSNPEPGDGEEEITTASKISIDKATTSLYVGETMTVKVGVLPADAVTKLSFSSGDPSIAVIDENGVLLARKAGQVNISVVDENSG